MSFIKLEQLNINLTAFFGKRLLLAHSGGLDSSVLAHLLLEASIDFSVAHCNFQLRGNESDGDADFVNEWCRKHNIPFFSSCFSTKKYMEFHKKNTQLAARQLRYQWFNSLVEAHRFEALLTAHHLNDQFETFIINTTRGTGISGLLGIQEKDKLYRPLLQESKNSLVAYAKKHKIKWREDGSNDTNDYLRNSIRHLVLEPLTKLQPQTLDNFKTTLSHLTQANSFINSSLDTLKQSLFIQNTNHINVSVAALMNIPQPLFCIHHWFSSIGFEAQEVLKLLDSDSGKILISKSHRLLRDRSNLILIENTFKKKDSFPIDLKSSDMQLPINLSWEFIVASSSSWESYEAALDYKLLKNSLFLRKSMKGDYFYPTGMTGKKSLSKFFKDEKYSLLEKEDQWLLCSGDKIVWVVGKRCDRRFTANKKTETTVLITWA
ncbi:MAG: tRNA(Ile)-lysidine synthase [Flavobacteriaceae bacterium]